MTPEVTETKTDKIKKLCAMIQRKAIDYSAYCPEKVNSDILPYPSAVSFRDMHQLAIEIYNEITANEVKNQTRGYGGLFDNDDYSNSRRGGNASSLY